MKVKYTGPAKDYSGYGEAVRHDIASLIKAGIDVTCEIPVYTPQLSDFGPIGELALERENKEIGYKVKILHTTPNVYTAYMEPDKYHVGRAFWETDKVPLDFAKNLQQVDEIWTGSEFNKQAIRNAGVTKPIFIIPEAIDDEVDISLIKPFILEPKNDFKFYSIFEWTARKNPTALLEAFWRAFEDTKGVCLILKTYLDSFKQSKKDEIDRDIKKLKNQLGLKNYAPVYLYRQLMDRRHIYRLHKTGDCFISTHRGEGWGIPQMEAMLMGNPIISTNIGGIHEYLKDKKDALLLPYKLIPVKNSRNEQWYTPDQKWGDVDIEATIEAMRFIFDNQDKAKKIGKAGRKTVKKISGLKSVGAKMRERLYQINNIINPPAK